MEVPVDVNLHLSIHLFWLALGMTEFPVDGEKAKKGKKIQIWLGREESRRKGRKNNGIKTLQCS